MERRAPLSKPAIRIDLRFGPRRALWAGVLLAVVVVIVAGMSGTAHFSGPRWVPHIHLKVHTEARPHVHPPTSGRLPAVAPARVSGSFPLGALVIWTVVALVALAVAFVLWRLWAGRASRSARSRNSVAVQANANIQSAPEPQIEPDLPTLRTGIELALEMLDQPNQPADAIVRAWLGLQETAQQSGIVRQAAETPTEFTSRIMGRALTDDRPVRTLLRLYLRTRFGDTPVTAEDVDAVRAALEELVRTWPAPAPSAPRIGTR